MHPTGKETAASEKLPLRVTCPLSRSKFHCLHKLCLQGGEHLLLAAGALQPVASGAGLYGWTAGLSLYTLN